MGENVSRIEPARLEDVPEQIADLVAEVSAESATLGTALHATTAGHLASLIRIMNTYYSNLIEGHDTRPRDIERALDGNLDQSQERRNLQLEAAAHVRVQAAIDKLAERDELPEPASKDFICWLHREFYRNVPVEMLRIVGPHGEFQMEPGIWRRTSVEDVAVGRHLPPSSERVADFMDYFERRYDFSSMGRAARIISIAAAHHRFNYIHPFPDGNGRVSRLMSHAMALKSGIGAHGLWSISRGLARGLESRGDYKRMMDYADSQRFNDYDGRGNLSQKALIELTSWFLRVCIDQIRFMKSLFELNQLERRLSNYVVQSDFLKPESIRLLQEALVRGEVDRGDAVRLTRLPERSARRVLTDVINEGLLASESPKGPVSLRFPTNALEVLFPRLYPES